MISHLLRTRINEQVSDTTSCFLPEFVGTEYNSNRRESPRWQTDSSKSTRQSVGKRTAGRKGAICIFAILHTSTGTQEVFYSNNNAAVDQLQTVYNRIEQCNNALSDLSARTPTLSATQLQSAEQAVQLFVATMRDAANSADSTAKFDLTRAMTYGTLPFSSNNDDRIVPPIYVDRLHNNELSLLDDIAQWYSIGKEIGRGTFGHVRLGTHRLSGTPVAIKSYTRLDGAKSCLAVDAIGKRVISDSGGDALEWRRVRQEINVLAKLPAHSNIMRFVEYFETPTRIHAITEHVRGTSLCDILRRAPGQRLPERRVKQIFRQIAAAVAALHGQRVIHRDLKLENVLFDEHSGHATVIDFGFSDFEKSSVPDVLDPAEGSSSRKWSKKKNFCGTPSYMAPEVVTSERYDGRPVDIWSLGVLLYVMLCGKFPFQGVGFHQLYQKLRTGAQQLVFISGLSTEVRDLLHSMLAVDPAKRPSACVLCSCSWLRNMESQESLPQQNESLERLLFEAWSGTRQAVCTALAELYGVQLDNVDLDQTNTGQSKHKRLSAFINLAKIVSFPRFRNILTSFPPQALLSSSSESKLQQNEETEIESVSHDNCLEETEPVSRRHKQQLEKLIGLVKISLGTQ
ncbi:unnamed protein product [Phytophthora lilii]|uniref:Unnamed protein product n=1 Tax=Phytophthora lilii TaxID=2077276 RepID=A0A9W6UD06_9STRA|nr:unnamed protein product [Phytophthora lilii]